MIRLVGAPARAEAGEGRFQFAMDEEEVGDE